MYRHSIEDLKKWFNKKRRKPLIIRGARQVGKSTLIRHFAKEEKITLYEINLERHRKLNSLFRDGSTEEVLKELEYICGKGSLLKGRSLLFLDEIQATPDAIAFLRYLYEEYPDLAVVSAGSLLEFTLSKHSYSMPVGRIEYLFLGPMLFSEFLLAHKENDLYELLNKYRSGVIPLSAHERLLQQFRSYLLVGGMPEAVFASCEGEGSESISDAHSGIIETYLDDFNKYGKSSQFERLQTVFRYVPSNVGQKVKYSHIDPQNQARDLKAAIELLRKAGVIMGAYHCDGNGLPLRSEINLKVQKLYFLDVGLLNNLCGVQHISMESLSSHEFINRGALAEQFVAQHIHLNGGRNRTPELNYWLREGKSNNAEIDFLLPHNGQIFPIEVKSGKSGSLKSLHRFMHDKKSPYAIRFDLNRPSQQTVDVGFKVGSGSTRVTYQINSYPVYLAEYLNNLIDG